MDLSKEEIHFIPSTLFLIFTSFSEFEKSETQSFATFDQRSDRSVDVISLCQAKKIKKLDMDQNHEAALQWNPKEVAVELW